MEALSLIKGDQIVVTSLRGSRKYGYTCDAIYHHKKVTALQIYNPDLQKTMGEGCDGSLSYTNIPYRTEPASPQN